jgi:hypothetical protein
MNWRRNAAGFFFGTLLLVSCSTTQVPEPKAEPKPSEPLVGINNPKEMPRWFWNPSWWTVDGPIVQEVKDTLNQNSWVLQGVRRINAESNAGSWSDPYDMVNAYQKWDSPNNLLTVVIPLTTGNYASGALVHIQPTWNFFGPHTWTIVNVSFLNLREFRFSSPGVPVSPAGVGGSSPPSTDRILVSTSVNVNVGGSNGKATSRWINVTKNTLVQTLTSVRNVSSSEVSQLMTGTISPAGINKCYYNVSTQICQDPNKPNCGPGQAYTANIKVVSCSGNPPPPPPNCTDLRNELETKRQKADRAEQAGWATFGGALLACGFSDPATKLGRCILGGVLVGGAIGNANASMNEYQTALEKWESSGCSSG